MKTMRDDRYQQAGPDGLTASQRDRQDREWHKRNFGMTAASMGISTGRHREHIMVNRRSLTYEERAVWGICPICREAPGVPCDKDFGIGVFNPLGMRLSQGGAHMARLEAAPTEIQEEEVNDEYK